MCSGLVSALAPTSSTVQKPLSVGKGVMSAGRMMPRMRPILRMPAASAPPVFPAVTKAWASPLRTIWQATTMELSLLLRTAWAGFSPISMTWLAGTMGRSNPVVSCLASSAWSKSGGPTSETVIRSSRAASTAPATVSSA